MAAGITAITAITGTAIMAAGITTTVTITATATIAPAGIIMAGMATDRMDVRDTTMTTAAPVTMAG